MSNICKHKNSKITKTLQKHYQKRCLECGEVYLEERDVSHNKYKKKKKVFLERFYRKLNR